MNKPILIYVVSLDYDYEGLGSPEMAFFNKEDAEKYIKENTSDSTYVSFGYNEVALV